MAFISAKSIASSINNRFPANTSATVDLQASEETKSSTEAPTSAGTVDIQAQALRSYTQPAGKFVNVKALQDHYVAGNFVSAGNPEKGIPADIIEVTETDSATLIALGRAALATDDEVAAAQKAAAKTK